MRDRWDALGRPVLEARELEQVPHGRVHVAPLRVLGPVAGHGEGVLARPLGRVGHHQADEAHALGLEGRLVLDEQRRDAREQSLLRRRAVGHALAQRDVQLVDRLRGVGEAGEQAGQLRGQRGERGHHGQLPAAHGQRGVTLRVVGALVLEVRDHGLAHGGGLELEDVEGAVEALDCHLHRRLADLLVSEEREQGVDHEAAADGGAVGALGLELLLELGHHLVEGLLGLVEAKLRRGERHLLVGLAGELGELCDDVEGWGQLAQGCDAEALGEVVELAEQRDGEGRSRLECLVGEGRADHVVEALGVGLDQRGHRLVGGGLREEGGLYGDVAAEERADGGHRVVAQTVGVRLGDGRERREGDDHALLLALEHALDVVGHLLLEGGHEHDRLSRVLARDVGRLGRLVERLQLGVELGGQLLAERGGGVLHLGEQQVDALQRGEHLLDEGVHLLDDVAVHDELEALERRAVGLQRRLARGHARLVGKDTVVRQDLLDLARVLERERGQQVALVDDRARLLLVRDSARLGRLDGDEHLHGFGLGEGGARLDLRAVLDEVAHELARDVGAQLGRVVHGGQQHRHAVEDHAQAERLLACEDAVVLLAVGDEERAVGLLQDLDDDLLLSDGEQHRVARARRHLEAVLDVLVGDLERDLLHLAQGQQRELPLLEGRLEADQGVLDGLPAAEHGGVDDGALGVDGDTHALLSDDAVEPRRVDGVLLEGIRLEELAQVLDRGADLSEDEELLEGAHKRTARLLARRRVGEDVAELRVGVLVHAAVGDHREVAPHLLVGLEDDALDLARGGLEALIGVLGRDARRDAVARVGAVGLEVVEVDLADGRLVLLVELAHLRHVPERDAHGHVQLRARHAHARDALGDRVLHLQARVELEEVELLGVEDVHVLDRARRDVAKVAAEVDRGALHLDEDLVVGHDGWALLEDLLEAALRRAVAPAERDGVAVLVAHDLHLQVARALAELHEEDRRAGHLAQHLRVGGAQRVLVPRHADALAAAALGRLEHDGVADAVGGLDGLLLRVDARGVELLEGDVAQLVEVRRHAVAVPWHRRDARLLRHEVGSDLVAEHAHHGRGRADEGHLLAHQRRLLLEHVAQLGVLGGVAPADHDSVHILREAKVDDELHVGVVVGVAAARHLDELVGAADELRVRREVLRGGHDHKLHRLLVAEGLVRPLADRHDRLGRGHAVVGDEDPADQAVAAALLHVLPHTLLQRSVALIVLGQIVHHRRLVCGDHRHGGRQARRAVGAGSGKARRPGRNGRCLHQPWAAEAGLERCNQRAHREQHRGRLDHLQ
mmetsp:Transcript_32537/g.76880  ORF Transcript_32537/g.76880 Transcript_32537/m.76880 type:complete len:1302 (-) Transcript_32537:34-3939(-)